MDVKISLKFANDSCVVRTGYINEPEQCPMCKAHIKPQQLSVHTYLDSNGKQHISALYLCKSCYKPFLTLHDVQNFSSCAVTEFKSKLVFVEPQRFEAFKFDDKIVELSPSFVEIYNQSLQAETLGLDQIAGIGYRKALEFLIKDYAIFENFDNEEKIKNMLLSNCIDQFIENDHIKTLAKRSAWIGNDETHYVRKHTDRDVKDMKAFIQAIVYFIGMLLITEDAESISPNH